MKLEELNNLYYLYKERLFKHFITLGDPKIKGSNLIVNKRYVCNSNLLKFSDTTIDLAYYLSFLASDYYLTKNQETLNLIINTLHSLNRLDLYSKQNFDKNVSAELTGFFVRDDITNVELFKYFSSILDEETFDYDTIIDRKMISLCDDRSSYDPITYKRATERNVMSQDQFWHLFYGLSLTKKLTDVKIVSDLINDIIDRFLTYTLKICNQVIKNPITKKPVPRGANMMLFAYGFAKVGETITGYKNKYTKMLHFWNKPLYKIAVFGAEFIYNMTNNIFRLSIKEYSYRSLGCVANLWWDKKYIKHLINNFEVKDWYPHFVLSHNILHNSDISNFNKEKLEHILSSIPNDGTVHRFKGKPIHYVWCIDNYLVNPEYSHFDDNQIGSYSAIDWLLLYNLYKIVYNKK